MYLLELFLLIVKVLQKHFSDLLLIGLSSIELKFT